MKKLAILLLLAFSSVAFGQGKGYKPLSAEMRAKFHAERREAHGGRMAMLRQNQALPAAFDCREKGWVHAVGDQANCGSCYLYSTIYGTLTSAFIRAGYGKADGTLLMSVQFGMDCHNFGGCNGGNGTEVIDWVMRNGWPAEVYVDMAGKQIKDYPPYEARSRTCREVAGAKRWKPATWGYATGDQSGRTATTDEIKTALYNYGPLNVSLDAGGQFGNGTGTITALGRSIDHEIELVAWDDSKQAFLLKNQWSTSWGNGGYRWCTYGACKNLVDVFWVSVSPLPPPPPPPPPDPDPDPGPAPTPGNVSITLTPAQVQSVLNQAGAVIVVKNPDGSITLTLPKTSAPTPGAPPPGAPEPEKPKEAPKQEPKKECCNTSFFSYSECADVKGPLITFLGAEPRPFHEFTVCTANELAGFRAPAIIVSQAGVWKATLPPTATDAQIHAAVKGVSQKAAPFLDPRSIPRKTTVQLEVPQP